MTVTVLVHLACYCAVIPAGMFLWNMLLYREPPRVRQDSELVPVSVLIPARNEERSIAASVRSVLGSHGIAFEVIVLDDASADRTAEIVRELSKQDARVRLEPAPSLPRGWNGKQHACQVLSQMARHPVLCFLDADVRLAPDALARMSMFMIQSRAALVSGFPVQETQTWLERLLLPLIHFVLLAYLPLAGMRVFPAPGFAAGCGQFLMVRRDAYLASGGHSSIRTTMHDGILLPRVFRTHGFRTDIADMTSLAACRMYQNAPEVWRGLTKNATEGMAAPVRILPFTALLLLGQVLPLLLACWLPFTPAYFSGSDKLLLASALLASYLPRLLASFRYRQSFLSAVAHPFGVATLLVLQWNALSRKLSGQPAHWKERAYTVG